MAMPPYILVIEPDFRRLKALRVLLQAHRHMVRTTESATDAAILLAGSRPALVLVDLGLTDAQGLPLPQRIRAAPDLDGLPVIGLADPPQAADPLRTLGCTAVVTRPFDPAALAALVRQWLDAAPGQ